MQEGEHEYRGAKSGIDRLGVVRKICMYYEISFKAFMLLTVMRSAVPDTERPCHGLDW
jgi:hypothetical protein